MKKNISENETEKWSAKLISANKKLVFQNAEKEKRAGELIIANEELLYQNGEKEKRAAELKIANVELIFQNTEKENRAAELNIANIELVFQNNEKEKRAAELIVANVELIYQNGEKEKRAAELIIANVELIFQNTEKENRAAELNIANIELVFQNNEKEKRASELNVANVELIYQNGEKEKRAAELKIANIELVFQNGEKEKRAAELIVANIELVFQNDEKEKRASELIIANVELIFQNGEKEKRASELSVALQELALQNYEKEKLAVALNNVNKELETFAYVASHDLQEPLRKIQTFISRINDNEDNILSDKSKEHFIIVQDAASRMQTLIIDILAFSRVTKTERKFEEVDLNKLINEIIEDLKESIDEKKAIIETQHLININIIPFQFRQAIQNLIYNALKFSKPGLSPVIKITSEIVCNNSKNKNLLPDIAYCHISIADNGIGFDPDYSESIFEVFKKLHGRSEYKGTGIGLAIVKKVIENHNGYITATGNLNAGATFDIFLPVTQML